MKHLDIAAGELGNRHLGRKKYTTERRKGERVVKKGGLRKKNEKRETYSAAVEPEREGVEEVNAFFRNDQHKVSTKKKGRG